jgi:hypothetical protein
MIIFMTMAQLKLKTHTLIHIHIHTLLVISFDGTTVWLRERETFLVYNIASSIYF